MATDAVPEGGTTQHTKSYTQVRNGKVVHVDGYNKQVNPTDEITRADPSRPPMSFKSGLYPRGRNLPYLDAPTYSPDQPDQ